MIKKKVDLFFEGHELKRIKESKEIKMIVFNKLQFIRKGIDEHNCNSIYGWINEYEDSDRYYIELRVRLEAINNSMVWVYVTESLIAVYEYFSEIKYVCNALKIVCLKKFISYIQIDI